MGFYCFSYSSKDTHVTHACTGRDTNKPAIGTLAFLFLFHCNLTRTVQIFIIHSFVLHTDNMLAVEGRGGRSEGGV